MTSRGKRVPSPPGTPQVAASLARIGWPVFPVSIYEDASGKRHKVPAVKWKAEATTDPKTVAAWWAGEYAGCWIGVYAGAAGIVVVDVDPGGDESIAAAGHELPETFTYPTHRPGAHHHVYAAPEGVDLTIAKGLVENVDVRSGAGLMVYYGPELHAAPDLAPAPDWALVARDRPTTASGGDRAPSATEDAYRARLSQGKPDADVRDALATVKSTGMGHDDMLAAVSALVALGAKGHPGVGAALDEARDTYATGWPDADRAWDKAVEGSIRRWGLPPVTFEIPKPERKAIKRRNTPDRPKGGAVTGNASHDIHVTAGDDSALAVATAERFRDSLARVSGAWREYDGKRWGSVTDDHVVELVRAALEERGVAAFRANDTKLATWLVRRTTIEGTAKLMRGRLERQAADFDAYPDELNVANGIVDLQTGELRPHDPTRLHTKITRAPYEQGASHPDVTAVLKALPRESREWMQVRIGQAATGHVPDDDVVVVEQGAGANAKSTWNGMLLGALGDYAAIMPEQLLLATQGDHPTALMELMGLRLGITEELPEGHALNIKRLKDVAGTSMMKARRMRQDFVAFAPTHALIASSNYEPRVAETDHGTWRRLALVRFPYRYVNEPTGDDERLADRRLRSRVGSGRGGRDEAVLAWIVDGAMKWYANGMVMPEPPARVVADTEAWREVSDTVFAFANDRLVFAPDAHASATELLHALNTWLIGNGRKSWSPETFASRFGSHDLLRAHNVTKTRRRLDDGTRPNLWLGVGLRPNDAVLDSFVSASSAHR